MSVYLRRYNVTLDLATAGSMRIRVPIRKAGSADFAAGGDWTPSAGDAANIGTLPSYSNGRWEFTLSGAELSARTVDVTIVDSAAKAVDDEAFTVETYGHAAAMYPTVYSGGSAGNPLTSGTGADQIAVDGAGNVAGVLSAGPGADAVTLRFFADAPDNTVPLADADVWVTADGAGLNPVAGPLQTGSDGRVTFLLDAGDDYFAWAQKDGYQSVGGQPFTAVAD
jgi:hypothetical protein